MASNITLPKFCTFLKELRTHYPLPVTLYVLMDNWHNVHRHPTTEALLEELTIRPGRSSLQMTSCGAVRIVTNRMRTLSTP